RDRLRSRVALGLEAVELGPEGAPLRVERQKAVEVEGSAPAAQPLADDFGIFAVKFRVEHGFLLGRGKIPFDKLGARPGMAMTGPSPRARLSPGGGSRAKDRAAPFGAEALPQSRACGPQGPDHRRRADRDGIPNRRKNGLRRSPRSPPHFVIS